MVKKLTDQQQLENWLESIGVKWPERHPYTGEPIVSGNVEQELEHSLDNMMPPGPRPEPVEDVFDFEGIYIGEWELPYNEHARRVEKWEEYCRIYRKQNGRSVTKGPVTITGRFETESGLEVEGKWADSRWLWDSETHCVSAGEGCEDGWMEDPDKEAKGPAIP